MSSVDVSAYLDLRPYDRDMVAIFQSALTAMQLAYPEWVPLEGNTEVVLLEAQSMEAAELIYAVNRVPNRIVTMLLSLFGVVRDVGAPSTATATFTMADTAGYTVPAGTTVRVPVGGGQAPVPFTTDVPLVVAAGGSTGTVAITSTENGTRPEAVAAGTTIELVDALFFVNGVTLATQPDSGRYPESGDEFLARGVGRLGRLVQTLVLPAHFSGYALEQPNISRAFAIDLYNPSAHNEKQTITITGAPTGGNFDLTFSGQTALAIPYNATAAQVQAALEALSNVAPGDVAVTGGPGPGTAWVVEFRASYAGQDVPAMTTTAHFTGGTTPAVAVTTTQAGNTTVGADSGYVTVAVLGVGGALLSDAAKATLQAAMDAIAYGPLTISVVDPTINVVNVTATVKAAAGYTTAQAQANVVAALQGFLSPATWAWGGVVRRNDLITLIESTEGVDYLTAGHPTTPAADVTLVGPAPLAQYGTLTITAT